MCLLWKCTDCFTWLRLKVGYVKMFNLMLPHCRKKLYCVVKCMCIRKMLKDDVQEHAECVTSTCLIYGLADCEIRTLLSEITQIIPCHTALWPTASVCCFCLEIFNTIWQSCLLIVFEKHRNRTCNIISTVQRTGCVQPQKSLWIIFWYILQWQVRYQVKCYILHTYFTWSNNLAQYMMNTGLNAIIVGLFSLFW